MIFKSRKHGQRQDTQNKLGTLIGETIGTDGFRMLRALMKGKVSSLPIAIRHRATSKIWSQAHVAFGVRSAADIPASQLDSARNFIASYVLDGEFIGRSDNSLEAALVGDQRLMVYLDSDGVRQVKAIPSDAGVMTYRDFMKCIVSRENISISDDELFGFAQAVMARLRERADYQAK